MNALPTVVIINKNRHLGSLTHRPARLAIESPSRQLIDCQSSPPSNRALCLRQPCTSGQATGRPSLSQLFAPVTSDGIQKTSKKTTLPSGEQAVKLKTTPAPSAGIAALSPPLSSKIVAKPSLHYQSSEAPVKHLIPLKNVLSTRAPTNIASSTPIISNTHEPCLSTASSLRSSQPSIQSTALTSTLAPSLVANSIEYPSSTISTILGTRNRTEESAYYYDYTITYSPSTRTLSSSFAPLVSLLAPPTLTPLLKPAVTSSAPEATQTASPTVKVVTLASQINNLPNIDTPQAMITLSPQSLRQTKSYEPAQRKTMAPLSRIDMPVQRLGTPEFLSAPLTMPPVAKIPSIPSVIMRPIVAPEVIPSPTKYSGNLEPKPQDFTPHSTAKFMLPTSPSTFISDFPQESKIVNVFSKAPLTKLKVAQSTPPSNNKPKFVSFSTFSNMPQTISRASTTPISYILNTESPSVSPSIIPVAAVTVSPTQSAPMSSIFPSKNSRAYQDGQVGVKPPPLGQSLFNFVQSKSAAPFAKQKAPVIYGGGGGYLRTNQDLVRKD